MALHRIASLATVALSLLGAAAAHAAQNDTPSADTTSLLQRYDGAWAGKASTVIVKAFAGHVQLNGRDSGSSWTAHCVHRSGALLCRGTGLTNTGLGFAFESQMKWESDQLRDDWRALFFEGQDLSGTDLLRRLGSP